MAKSGKSGKSGKAARRSSNAPARSPGARRARGDLAAWLERIEQALRQDDVALALATVRRALADLGEHPGLIGLRATLEQSLPTSQDPTAARLATAQDRLDAGDPGAALALAADVTRDVPELAGGWSLLAECQYRLGALPAAIGAARQAVALAPERASSHANLGVMFKAAGELDAAEASLRRALELDPRLAEAHLNLGSLYSERGDPRAAEACYRHALALRPDWAEAHFNLGNALAALDRRDAAQDSFRDALACDARLAAAANNLGNLLKDSGQLAEARAVLEQALASAPPLATTHYNLGNVLLALDEPHAASAAYRQALALDPDCVDAWLNLGLLQARLGQFEDAEASHRRALALAPERVESIEALALLLGALDRFDESAALFERALALAPDEVRLHLALGQMLGGCLQYERAERSLRRALELEPSNTAACCELAMQMVRCKEYEAALRLLEQGLTTDPDAVGLHQTRGRILMEMGLMDESEAAFRKSLELAPGATWLISNVLVAMAFTGHWSPRRIKREAEQWERHALTEAEREDARARVFRRAPRQGRRLRIGLLSSEMAQHAVAYFLLSWLRALDRDRFELFAYPGRNRQDDKVRLFKNLADRWRPLAGLGDAQAAELIRADDIDILIETTGHDADRRLGVVARRVAPVQCHYIGYFATTGLSQMDYFIGDAILIPPAHDAHFTETVWRLPRTRYAYEPLEEAPEPRWWPDPDGGIWVGSFNNLIKVRDESLALWAKVLHALPEARLALKDNKGANRPTQSRILDTLRAQGIAEERVAFLSFVPDWRQHMDYYNRLDVALDSVPFNSATTGFDALWMGCPLVTLIGDRLSGRQAASLLTGLGRAEWIAETEDDYVRIAVELARDRERRRRIRETQRERMRQSELCDGPGLARVLEDTFDEMYARWHRAADGS